MNDEVRGLEEILKRFQGGNELHIATNEGFNSLTQTILSAGFVRLEDVELDEEKIADILETELPWLREDLVKLAIKIKENI